MNVRTNTPGPRRAGPGCRVVFIVPVMMIVHGVSFLGGFASGPADPVPSATIAARVNGMPIHRSEFDEAMSTFIEENGPTGELDDAERKRIEEVVLDGLIGSLLLYQRALAIPIQVPGSEVEKVVDQVRRSRGAEAFAADLVDRRMTEVEMLALVRRNLTVQRLIQETIMAVVTVTEAEIIGWYEANPAAIDRPEAVRASHILIKSSRSDSPASREQARERIERAEKKLAKGEIFPEVARSVSEDASAERGGALGWVARGTLIPELDAAFFGLAEGQVSGIVESPFGFHILKVDQKRKAGRPDLEEAREGILEILRQRKSAEALDRLVVELRAGARIETFPMDVPRD